MENKTDLDKFIELYRSIGIEPEVTHIDISGGCYIRLNQGDSNKLIGYYYFYTMITFDSKGKFVNQGFYE